MDTKEQAPKGKPKITVREFKKWLAQYPDDMEVVRKSWDEDGFTIWPAHLPTMKKTHLSRLGGAYIEDPEGESCLIIAL